MTPLETAILAVTIACQGQFGSDAFVTAGGAGAKPISQARKECIVDRLTCLSKTMDELDSQKVKNRPPAKKRAVWMLQKCLVW